MNGPPLARRLRWLAVLAAMCGLLVGLVALDGGAGGGGSARCAATVLCEPGHAPGVACGASCSHPQPVISSPASVLVALIAPADPAFGPLRRAVPSLVRSRLFRPPQR